MSLVTALPSSLEFAAQVGDSEAASLDQVYPVPDILVPVSLTVKAGARVTAA